MAFFYLSHLQIGIVSGQDCQEQGDDADQDESGGDRQLMMMMLPLSSLSRHIRSCQVFSIGEQQFLCRT